MPDAKTPAPSTGQLCDTSGLRTIHGLFRTPSGGTRSSNAPDAAHDVARVRKQRKAVAALLDSLRADLGTWRSNPGRGDALARDFGTLTNALVHPLDDEEQHIMPVAARTLTQAEWDKAHQAGKD